MPLKPQLIRVFEYLRDRLREPRRFFLRCHVAYVTGDFTFVPGGRLFWPLGYALAKAARPAPPPDFAPSTEPAPADAIRDLYRRYRPGALPTALRDRVSAEIARHVRSLTPNRYAATAPAAELATLRREGILHLPRLRLTTTQLRDVRDYFERHPVYNAHLPYRGDGVPRRLNENANAFVYGSYLEHDALRAPHLLDLAFDDTVLSLAENYLGCAPTLYNVNTWWSFRGRKGVIAQDYHRDLEDHRFLALFVLLTDVPGGTGGGQHDFLHRTHDEAWLAEKFGGDRALAQKFFPPRLDQAGYFQGAMYERIFAGETESIAGQAGQVFLADTWALHRGVPPTVRDRLVCWMRLGLTGNIPFQEAPQGLPLAKPYFADPYRRFVARALVRGEPLSRAELTDQNSL